MQAFDLASLPDLEGREAAGKALLRLLASPELADKRWVWRQYDHQVLTNTVVGPGSDAAVLRVKGTKKGIALTTDGNGLYCYLDPYAGGAIAVAEAARNVVCAGAQPLAVTDCLNFGNPEKLDVYYQMEETVRGMAAACEKLGDAGHLRQRQPLQRDERRAGRADAGHRHAGSAGGRREALRDGLPGSEGDEVFLLGATLDAPVIVAFGQRVPARDARTHRRPAARSTSTWRRACSGSAWRRSSAASCVRRTTARRAGWRWRWRSAASPAAAAWRAATRRRAAGLTRRSSARRSRGLSSRVRRSEVGRAGGCWRATRTCR